jgi:hypothetical protein
MLYLKKKGLVAKHMLHPSPEHATAIDCNISTQVDQPHKITNSMELSTTREATRC